MTDREAIAARIEAATGPDRELDCRIWAMHTGGNFDTYRAVVPDFGQWQAPYYTASIDAAMMLVPEGCVWLRKDQFTMTVYKAPADGAWAKHVDAVGATPALALAAAAICAGGV
ncbi:hypothetical protein UFOVP319_22 [uncultured Caudovirales phage]|uniref:Phage ABA sandwich domain-containing protein n=1 Tax=uncultured Caudovirales phage TaxID=2100421 RepID=A0A6J5LT13_9CAUD|nr:hypothetical protein UFOVP319_22 [uncultured Caudovirales phage]